MNLPGKTYPGLLSPKPRALDDRRTLDATDRCPYPSGRPLWKVSCEAYADYLRGISQLIEPYGILPSAVYEVDNTDYKNLYHEGEQVGLPSLEEYNAQVRNGIPLSKDFYLRRFPSPISSGDSTLLSWAKPRLPLFLHAYSMIKR